MKKQHSRKQVFQKKYFTEYYAKMTGNFEHKDFVRNYNWFYGWFDAVQDWYDFRQGKNRKVLEFGCSIGAAAALLGQRGFDVTATDVSAYAVKKAKKLLPDMNVQVLDIDQPPTSAMRNAFDLVYGFEVIEHIEDPRTALRHLRMMLKKNGVLLCSTPYPYAYTVIDKTHISVQYPQEWVSDFRKAGFREVKWKQVSFIPFLYRLSKYFHIRFPFGLPTRYINSTIFIYARK